MAATPCDLTPTKIDTFDLGLLPTPDTIPGVSSAKQELIIE